MALSIAEQLACVDREIRMRQKVYPRWVQQHKMLSTKAEHELEAMKAVRESLLRLKAMDLLVESLPGYREADLTHLLDAVRADASGQDKQTGSLFGEEATTNGHDV